MIMTANNFAIIILNIFSFSKFMLRRESGACLFCVNIFAGTAMFSLVIYLIVHMGHFTLREVRWEHEFFKLSLINNSTFLARPIRQPIYFTRLLTWTSLDYFGEKF